MNLQLDHFFILVEPGAQVAERLSSLGMQEGAPNRHEGQGTSNRRFYFENAMLELLWVRDAEEANHGPGRELCFPARASDLAASPFGIILLGRGDTSSQMPFAGWSYQPDYFFPPNAFHVGANSSSLLEPLCFYVPFITAKPPGVKLPQGAFKSVSKVHICTPSETMSDVLAVAATVDNLCIEHGDQHLMEITFDEWRCRNSKDLRPDLPLIIHW